MTDTTQTSAPPAVVDISPAANVSGPAPVVQGTDPAFEENLNLFLGHSLQGDDPMEPKDVPETPAPTPAPVPPAASGEPTPAPTPAPTAAPEPAPVAPAPAPGVDPALLAEMVLGTEQAPPAAQPAPVAAAPPAPAPAAPAQPSPEGETYAPFDAAQINVPAPLVAALFEADDPVVRNQALNTLIAAIGNSVTSVMEQRIKEHHAPSIRTSFQQEALVQQRTNAVVQDLYSAAEDLKPYGRVVERAFQLVASKNPNAPYSPELRDQIIGLARQTLKSVPGLGYVDPATSAPPSPPAPAPAPYTAGGARPGGFMEQPKSGNDPAGLLDSLTFN